MGVGVCCCNFAGCDEWHSNNRSRTVGEDCLFPVVALVSVVCLDVVFVTLGDPRLQEVCYLDDEAEFDFFRWGNVADFDVDEGNEAARSVIAFFFEIVETAALHFE